MDKVQRMFFDILTAIASDDKMFLRLFKETFKITEICSILKINRNRYNYLVRSCQLDKMILDFKEKYEEENVSWL